MCHLRSYLSEKMYSQTEKQRYDGWYNNLAHPDWGSVGKWTDWNFRQAVDNFRKRVNWADYAGN